ncbi:MULTISPECIES: LPXTG cell wall anchor domain-containing protein [Sphingobacterium]|uniref:LPXTG cell wall anchor domain-containing protein n=1 Tax=Sphingobacterium litopenaei TaxID=2763500 RepID=A0ABR7YG37_9SPHI|nr:MULTISPECIES: LPXTG cell wall anchor domain-containing protein [Sphingobacterium]MBD1430231.1 LPXTG cell wall anchor domain-containing protein [Sphingobacterium litopenaei]NGM71861.1 LPXTG cell wall anchor domain-containing protein [Sphingobacterium sp. SGL-16]
MKPKTIIIAILLALVGIILFNNKEESSFWLFGDIRTSKLLILGIFFLLGVITGGILFRRRKKHPSEYGINNPVFEPRVEPTTADDNYIDSPYKPNDGLSDEDREFLRRD